MVSTFVMHSPHKIELGCFYPERVKSPCFSVILLQFLPLLQFLLELIYDSLLVKDDAPRLIFSHNTAVIRSDERELSLIDRFPMNVCLYFVKRFKEAYPSHFLWDQYSLADYSNKM